MPTIQLHYDGWLTLPADARKHLDVATGDRLEVELTDGGVVLRLAEKARPANAPEPEVATAHPTAAPVEPALVEEAAAPKRGVGRPRKPTKQDLVPSVKVGGRRKSSPA